MGFWLTSLSLALILLLVHFPISMVRFSPTISWACPSFPKLSVKLSAKNVLHRMNDSNSFALSGDFSLNIASTISSFHCIQFSSISCPNHLVRFMKNSDFLLLARYPVFSSVFGTSNCFFPCHCWFSRGTTIISPSHASILKFCPPSVKFCGYNGQTVEPRFEHLISAELWPL